MTLKLKNGRLPDGTRTDVLIEDGRIAAVGENLPDGSRTVELEGAVLSPGFVDVYKRQEYIYFASQIFRITE